MLNQLKNSDYSKIFDFLFTPSNKADLVEQIKLHPSQSLSLLQNLKIEGSETIAAKQLARLIYSINLKDLENPAIRKIETTLRNKGIFNRTHAPDIMIETEDNSIFPAHKTLLAFESSYFKRLKEIVDPETDQITVKEMGIPRQIFQIVLDYVYLSDQQRKVFISSIEKQFLVPVAQLANAWQMDELKRNCNEELYNLQFTPDEIEALSKMDRHPKKFYYYEGPPGSFDRGFGNQHTMLEVLEIPSMAFFPDLSYRNGINI